MQLKMPRPNHITVVLSLGNTACPRDVLQLFFFRKEETNIKLVKKAQVLIRRRVRGELAVGKASRRTGNNLFSQVPLCPHKTLRWYYIYTCVFHCVEMFLLQFFLGEQVGFMYIK